MIGKAYTWKASGQAAVTVEVGRLFHKGIVRGKKELFAGIGVGGNMSELIRVF